MSAHRTAILVVQAADLKQANLDASSAFPGAGPNNLRGALSTSETGTPTHYWCVWDCTEDQFIALAALFANVGTRKMWDGEKTTPDDVLATLKVQPTTVGPKDAGAA